MSISSISLITCTRVAAHEVVASGIVATTSIICCTLVDICVVTNAMSKSIFKQNLFGHYTVQIRSNNAEVSLYCWECKQNADKNVTHIYDSNTD